MVLRAHYSDAHDWPEIEAFCWEILRPHAKPENNPPFDGAEAARPDEKSQGLGLPVGHKGQE